MRDPLEEVGAFIDLVNVPYTERGSRLLIRANQRNDELRVDGAVYERPLAACGYIRSLRLIGATGAPIRLAGARPDEVRWAGGLGSLTFADPAILSLAVTPDARTIELSVFDLRDHAARSGSATSQVPGHCVTWAADCDQYLVDDAGRGIRVCIDVDDRRGARLLIQLGPHGSAPAAEPHAICRASAEVRWRRWFMCAPVVAPSRRAMTHFAWWVLAANVIRLDGFEVVAPSKQQYVAAWQWDAYFTAIGLRHGAGTLARDQIRLFISHQQPDGFIPDVVHDSGIIAHVSDLPPSDLASLARTHGPAATPLTEPTLPITKPPLAAWAAAKIDEIGDHPSLLNEIWEQLRRLRGWWLARPRADGLPGYEHPYSSGLDDSPLFDHGAPVYSPDLPSYLVVEADILSAAATRSHRRDEAAGHQARADELSRRLITNRWDPLRGRFLTRTPKGESPVNTPFALLPLLTGRLPDAMRDTLVAQLHDTRDFYPLWPVPTVALSDPEFDPNRMWRGPTWLNVNWLLVEALIRSNCHEKAQELAEQTLDMVIHGRGLHEYWNPYTGSRAAGATTCFSWSAALFVDLANRTEHQNLGCQ